MVTSPSHLYMLRIAWNKARQGLRLGLTILLTSRVGMCGNKNAENEHHTPAKLNVGRVKRMVRPSP